MQRVLNGKSDMAHAFLLATGYALFFYAAQTFLYYINAVPNLPQVGNICTWDAAWYQSIVLDGYKHGAGPSNTGFFVLFPWIWKLSHLGVRGICLLNILFFSAGFALLCGMLRPSLPQKLLMLTTPSLFFAFIPYTEALFFFLSAILLYGLHLRRNGYILFALFFLSLTRATVLVFVPAFMLLEMLTTGTPYMLRSLLKVLWLYIAPVAAGLLTFVVYQYLTTGVWFAYFYQQSVNWERKFSMPVLPFASTLNGDSVFWAGAFAMFAGCLAALFIVGWLYKRLLKGRHAPDRLLIFSALYLAGTMLVVIFFNPKWGSFTTNIMGMHRYALATPFFFVCVQYVNSKGWKWQQYLMIVIAATCFWLLFGSYLRMSQAIWFSFITLLVLCYFLFSDRKAPWASYLIIVLNFMLQIHLMQQFIAGVYPD